MKKFISLVLALVMALSLTTIAWGAPVADQAAWDAAIASANSGDTIELGAGTFNLGTLGASAPAELTIVGTTGTVVTYFGVAGGYQGKITVKNCTFEVGSVWCGVCIEGKGTFTFDGCEFVVAAGKDPGSAIYMTAQYTDNEYVIKNCSFSGEYNEAAVVVQKQGAVTDYDVTVSGNDFDDVDGLNVGVWGKDATLNLTSDVAAATMVNSAAGLESAVANAEAGDIIALVGDVTVTTPIAIDKPITIDENGHSLSGMAAGSDVTTDASGKVTGGTFADAPANVADGYTALLNTDGTYIVVPAVTMGDKYDLYQADAGMATALKLGAEDVAGLTFNEVGAKTNQDGSGRVAYIAANNGQFFVKTTNPTVADYAVTYAGKTDVLYYVYVGGTSAANFEYSEVVKAFDNWGKKCGQYDNTLFTKEQKADDYFMAANYKVYRAADAGVGTNYLLDGVVVSGVELGYTIDHNFVANNFKYDSATGTNVPTSAICTKCLMQSTAIYKIGKAPANSTVKPLSVDGVVSTVWEVVPVAASAAAPVVTPSTDKVTSADTFDAGIAMYVGMSVMAAAGSAVVLKKKD